MAFGHGGAYEGWEIREISERIVMKTAITNEQAETIAAEVYARTPVDSTEAAFQLDWELVRAGAEHANSISSTEECQHGKTYLVNDCLRCGAPVCCGKCCADEKEIEPDIAGEIADQLTKSYVIDIASARAVVDKAMRAVLDCRKEIR
jgi:hypothetical protein